MKKIHTVNNTDNIQNKGEISDLIDIVFSEVLQN